MFGYGINRPPQNFFAGLLYERKLNNRELAIVSILSSGGADIGFKLGVTVSDAIEEERRRMTVAAKRVRTGRRTWSPFAPESAEPDAPAPPEEAAVANGLAPGAPT